MLKKATLGVFVWVAVFAFATPVSALTIADLQAQVQALVSQIASLTGQGSVQAQGTITANPMAPSARHRVCAALYRNLSRGSWGDDVLALQEFLQSQGYLSANATGYFGPATAQALARWQAREGLFPAGRLGPLTRERIALWCGSPTPPPPTPTPAPTPTPTPDPSSDPRCRSWYDGCNDCSRQTPGGPAMCTLRACFWQAPAYCKQYFDGGANKPPVVSGFSGPTTLAVNSTGTWTINASDPENAPLSYQITWGDEGVYGPMMSAAAREFVQTTTFTHAYASAGTYTVTIVVRDSAGQEAKASTTVRVDASVNCTMEYAPVCGQPPEPQCRRIPPYCMIPTPGPQTYGNRCMMNAAGATFLYDGACHY